MVTWGEYSAGDCVHGAPADACRVCHPSREDHDSPWALLCLALLLLVFALVAPSTIARDRANDEAQQQRHRAFVEKHAPSVEQDK